MKKKKDVIRRVISFDFKPNKNKEIMLKSITYATWKLWNVANYERKNWTNESGKEYPNWYVQKKTLKDHFWYKNLPSQSAQELLNQLDQSWKSFYTLIKTGGIENPRPPRFKHSNFNIRFLNNGFKIIDNKLYLSISKQMKDYLHSKYEINEKYLIIDIPKEIKGNPKIIEIIPKLKGYSINIIVELPIVQKKEDNRIYMSIDMGVNNLMSCFISNGKTFIISGRQLLSINRYFDKKISHYQGISSSQQYSRGMQYPKNTRRINNLYEKRKKQVNHFIHSCTKKIIDIARAENVSKIILGDIKNIRDDSNLGKVNNQKFHKLPFKIIKDKLTYKAEQEGIELMLQEESYSSQCSPNSIEVSKDYAKKSNRKYRGLYKENDKIYNADCVGAYNILRKYLCRIEKSYPAVVGLDTPVMYRWNSMSFNVNTKPSILMEV